jgi:hypothetical protein
MRKGPRTEGPSGRKKRGGFKLLPTASKRGQRAGAPYLETLFTVTVRCALDDKPAPSRTVNVTR